MSPTHNWTITGRARLIGDSLWAIDHDRHPETCNPGVHTP
jgi:hypothetical protein